MKGLQFLISWAGWQVHGNVIFSFGLCARGKRGGVCFRKAVDFFLVPCELYHWTAGLLYWINVWQKLKWAKKSLVLKRQVLQTTSPLVCGPLRSNQGLSVAWGLSAQGWRGGCTSAVGAGCSGWETSARPALLGYCNCVVTLPETPFLSILGIGNDKLQGWLLEICSCEQTPMWAYLQISVGAWIPHGRCRSVLQSVGSGCLPSAAEMGSREQGTVKGLREVPSGTPSSSLTLSRAAGSGLLQ